MKQQPEHKTWVIKQQQEEANEKPKEDQSKTKSQNNEERVNKWTAKKLKSLQKIAVFQTFPVGFSNKTIFGTKKAPMSPIMFAPPGNKNCVLLCNKNQIPAET